MSTTSAIPASSLSLSAEKPIEPNSPLTFAKIESPSICCASESWSAVRVAVPSESICAVNDATPSLSAGSKLYEPPTMLIENATSGRSRFCVTISSAPFASFVRVHVGT